MNRLLLTISCITIVYATLVAATPLTGIKTVGGTNPDYANLTEATIAVTSWGVGPGGVTFNVRPGTYNDMIYVYPIASSSADNPVIYQKESGTVTVSPSTTMYRDAAIKLFGCCYVTFDGIDVVDTSSGLSYLDYAYWVTNYSATQGASHNTIKNCSIKLRKDPSTTGIEQDYSYLISNASGSQSYNRYLNLKLSKCQTGLGLIGTSTFYDTYNEIGSTSSDRNYPSRFVIGVLVNDTISGYGILSGFQNYLSIHDMDIQNLIPASGGSTYGMNCNYEQGLVVHDTVIRNGQSSASGYTYGMICMNQVGYSIHDIETSGLNSSGSGSSYGINCSSIGGNSSLFNINAHNITTGGIGSSNGVTLNGQSTSSVQNIQVSNIQTTGNGNSNGISLNVLSNCSIQNIHLSDILTTGSGSCNGITLNGLTGCTIQNVQISDVLASGSGNCAGMSFSNLTGLTFQNNSISRVVSSGIGSSNGLLWNGSTGTSTINDLQISDVLATGSGSCNGVSFTNLAGLSFLNSAISSVVSSGNGSSNGFLWNSSSGTSSIQNVSINHVSSGGSSNSGGLAFVNLNGLTIENITIDSVLTSRTGSSYGISWNGNTGNSSIQNTTISNVISYGSGNSYGMSLGNLTTLNIHDNNINNVNTYGTAGIAYGLFCVYPDDIDFHNNEIQQLHSTANSVYGICCNNSSQSVIMNVYNNRIHDLYTTRSSSFGDVCGINCYYSTKVKYYNNFIWGLQSVATTAPQTSAIHIFGITGNSSTNICIDNNTVLIDQGNASTATCSSVAGSFVFVANNHDTLRNNIFANVTPNQTNSSFHYGINFTSAPSISDHNCFYLPNPTNGSIGLRGSTRCNLSSWQTLTHLDSNSIVGNPNFVTSTDLHIRTDIPTPIESRGVHISYITTDIDSQARSATKPDIGADEGCFLLDCSQIMAVTGTGGSSAWSPTFPNDQLTNNLPPIIVSFPANALGSNPTQMSCRRDTRTNAIASWGLTQSEIDSTLPPANWINRIWDINQTGGVNYDADLTLQFTAADLNGLVRSQIQYVATKHGTNPWTITPCQVNGPYANGIYTAVIHHVSNFSYWTIGHQTTLPVELTSFSATPGDTTVHLSWRVESETNNRLFRIYRSEDRTAIGDVVKEIAGRGTTSVPKSYSWTDIRVVNGRTYFYRLSDISLDGIESFYPNQVTATPRIGTGTTIPEWYPLAQNYPNPFNSLTKIRYQVARDGFVTLKLFNLKGELVRTLVNEVKTEGEYSIDVNLSGLPNGEYFYRLKTGSTTAVRKMVYLK